MVITRDGFFYPNLTRLFLDSFSYSPLSTTFYIVKNMKMLLENSEFAEMRQGVIILTLQ